jgi:7,8-dihydropterin-6-yl-methyl-4-(beta-D-ribofuranosyl)aminobenzene 5'-phosphate synthase
MEGNVELTAPDPTGLEARVTLRPVDSADVTILVDNAIDILVPPTPLAQRPPWAWEWSAQPQLRAEHGYSLLLTVTRGDRRETIIYDAGLGRDTVFHNMDVLGINPTEIRTVVMSHGHADHHGGLEGLYRRVGRMGLPLVLHPAIWQDRRVVFPTGVEIHMPPPSHQDLDREGWQVVEERGPSLLLDGTVLVTGQVPRVTEFERGMAIHQAHVGDHWEPDVWIWDDQAVVIQVAGKGLVVLSSCSHAGAINVLRHAQRLTGVDKIHAFVGGMHLTGGLFERIIPQTVAAMAEIGPDVIVPGHCSGWRAIHALAARLPDQFIQSNLGTRLHFVGEPPAA